MSYIVISESSLSCPPLVVLCAPPPLARFSFFPSFYLRLACSFFVFVLFGPSPRCPARVHDVLCARVPRAVLSPPSMGSQHRRISRSYPRSSRVFLPASRPANTRRPARYASNAGVSLCRI